MNLILKYRYKLWISLYINLPIWGTKMVNTYLAKMKVSILKYLSFLDFNNTKTDFIFFLEKWNKKYFYETINRLVVINFFKWYRYEYILLWKLK